MAAPVLWPPSKPQVECDSSIIHRSGSCGEVSSPKPLMPVVAMRQQRGSIGALSMQHSCGQKFPSEDDPTGEELLGEWHRAIARKLLIISQLADAQLDCEELQYDVVDKLGEETANEDAPAKPMSLTILTPRKADLLPVTTLVTTLVTLVGVLLRVMSELLKRGIPTWPMQLRRYAQPVLRNVPASSTDRTMGPNQVHDFQLIGSTRAGWTALMHLSGLLYYHKASKLDNFEAWIDASRNMIGEDAWILVAEPVRIGEDLHDRYEYYYAVEDQHTIAWHHTFNVGNPIPRVHNPSRVGSPKVRHELEAQFWKHVEYFPHDFNLQRSDVAMLRMKLNWLYVEAFTVEGSTAASTFGQSGQAKRNHDFVGYCLHRSTHDHEGKIQHILSPDPSNTFSMEDHHYFLHLYGRPEVRLLRLHSIEQTGKRNNVLLALSIAAMLGVPRLVINQLEAIYRQWDYRLADDPGKTAGVIMAVDCGILAIPVIGEPPMTKALEYTLEGGVFITAIMFSVPGEHHSTVWAIDINDLPHFTSASFTVGGFLTGVYLDSTQASVTFIMASISLIIVLCLLSLLVIVGFHPGLTYEHDQRNLLV
ncbi:hypothetical protein BU15DRAFT_67914 [Melanogaster broomeanus]|nr:hypothetical protein BU15DRAFT_67914 [Melanogaster broomeanus]